MEDTHHKMLFALTNSIWNLKHWPLCIRKLWRWLLSLSPSWIIGGLAFSLAQVLSRGYQFHFIGFLWMLNDVNYTGSPINHVFLVTFQIVSMPGVFLGLLDSGCKNNSPKGPTDATASLLLCCFLWYDPLITSEHNWIWKVWYCKHLRLSGSYPIRKRSH